METDKKYELELWSIQGHRVADISHLASNRKYTVERNEAETLTFDLDLDEFHRYCSENLNADPKTILFPYRTDVKVKRNGEYLFGTQVVVVQGSLAANERKLSVQCTGYLNLLKDRYITKSYVSTESTQIARDLITETQSQTNGDLGITLETIPYETGIKRARNYERVNAKQGIQNLTSLVSGNFDFSITWDKIFKVYEKIGRLRNDVELIYPGLNVVSADIERSGLNIYNRILGVGSGFGQEQVSSIQSDTDSELTYYIRERIAQFNSVVLQDTLDQNTAGVLQTTKDILEIPKIVITGNTFADGTAYFDIGDRVPVRVVDQPYWDNIDGLYRIERMEVSIDDNDFEESIALYFDDLNVDQTETAETDE